MDESAGIPQVIDLTHFSDLLSIGKTFPPLLLVAVLIAAIFGIVLAFLSRNDSDLIRRALTEWTASYTKLLSVLQHCVIVSLCLFSLFVLCSTLANRSHHWEQERISKKAQKVEGYRLEQRTPMVRYQTSERFQTFEYVNGKPLTVEKERIVQNYLNMDASTVQVAINQIEDPATTRLNYKVEFQGEYKVKNTLDHPETFYFDAETPYNYKLLEGFLVEHDGKELQAQRVNDRSFEFHLAPGQTTKFRVFYKAQGDPRWVYSADRVSLSNYSLAIKTSFPGAEFASGISPTRTQSNGNETTFFWDYKDNVSVRDPFGVFTSNRSANLHTGVLPRLLLLAPGIFLWWLLMLYFTVPLKASDVIRVAAVAFCSLLALTYVSRLYPAQWAWLALCVSITIACWLLHKPLRKDVLIASAFGFALPVFALLINYSGIMLSVSALLGVLWIMSRSRGNQLREAIAS